MKACAISLLGFMGLALAAQIPQAPDRQNPAPNTRSQRHGRPVVSLEVLDGIAIEPGFDSAAFRITRTGPTDTALAVEFTYGGTARPMIDYREFGDFGYNMVIPPGASNATFVLTPIDDQETEGDETVTITLQPSVYYEVADPGTALAIIQDDESLPTLYPAVATMDQSREALVAKWTDLLGSVPFEEEHLFTAMSYVHPQPADAFRPLTSETLTRPYQLDFQTWLNEFFKPPFRNLFKALSPSKYYLNGGRKEPSLLRYEFWFDGRDIILLENCNFFFFTIKPKDFSADKELNGLAVAELIFKWIRVKDPSPAEVARSFNLPSQLRLGDVFTNRSQPHLGLVGAGQNHVIGFISKQGICLMVPKAQEGRQAAGFNVDFNWANRQIFEADGTTRFDHPKYFEQAPKGKKSK